MSFWGIDAFIGGAGGPGKTSGLILVGLQGVMEKGYHCGFFRKTMTALTPPGGAISRLNTFLQGTDAEYNSTQHQWTFPSGATFTMGSLQDQDARDKAAGSEYQCILLDEAGQFTEEEQKFLFSRLRRTNECPLPIRFRRASNPLGPGRMYLKTEYVDKYEMAQKGEYVPPTIVNLGQGREVRLEWGTDTAFFPAFLKDNPHIHIESYLMSLAHLPPILLERILNGDWTVSDGGMMAQRDWFEIVDAIPASALRGGVSYWDLAATEEELRGKKGSDPDYTVGLLMVEDREYPGRFYILDVDRGRRNPDVNEQHIPNICKLHHDIIGKKPLSVRMEQEPAASGKGIISLYRRLLRGFNFDGERKIKDTVAICGPFLSAAKAGNIKLLRAPWNKDFLDEFEIFPDGAHDDVVVAAIGAHSELTKHPAGRLPVSFLERSASAVRVDK